MTVEAAAANRSTDAVVAGHICVDVIPDLSAVPLDRLAVLFRPGNLTEVGPVTLSTGGTVSNTGLALHKLGIRTQLIGKVGNDFLGHAICQTVDSRGPGLVDGLIVDETVNTSYTIVISPPGVDRIFLHHPGANEVFDAADVRYDVVAGARLFHFGYPPLMKRMLHEGGTQLLEMFQRVQGMGVTTSLDMAVPDSGSAAGRADWVAILAAVMPYVDVFLPSIEETLCMLRRETYEALSENASGSEFLQLISPALLSDLSKELLEMGGKVIGLKLGDRGLYIRTAGQVALEAAGKARPADPAAWADKELWSPCMQAKFVGAAGAGDATIAGFLTGLLRGLTLEDTLIAAVAVGACNVEAADTLSGIRAWDETWERINSGWARQPLEVDAPGWSFDRQRQFWVGPASD
jgi:sugar/nucleoside kinase (ribokinase family)